MPDYIDFSQYHSWMDCPWKWYERYINKRQKRWPANMRDDALAIGSLFHAGLECWYKQGKILIPEAIIVKINPTPEALRLCQRLVHGYVQTYPREDWKFLHTEQPCRFKLIEGMDGLAKIDLYFFIDRPTIVESGLPGYEITLRPGWWIQEYKTKGTGTSIADFMQEWMTKMQADFQMLALQGNLPRSAEMATNPDADYFRVNGLLVNVAEKPKDYIPRRKCQRCEEYYNFSAWREVGSKHACPVCGNEQSLKPVKMGDEPQPRYFRMIVERTAEQLAEKRNEIGNIAIQMRDMVRHRAEGCTTSFPPNRDHCFDVSKRYGKECEFYRPHNNGLSVIDHPDYESTEDYVYGDVEPIAVE